MLLGAADTARAVATGELDPVEAVEGALSALEARRDLNAVITLCAERALARARERPAGPLGGVPVLVKDMIDTAGVRTTYGSRIYADHVPERSAPAVLALEAAGAIVVGKSNTDEFAWGVTGQNPHWGDMGNPRRPGRIAGGSSGGNAAALAAGAVSLALGTDTGGSVRMPAACCGVVGFKLAGEAGTIEGVFPLVPGLDTLGPMARSVADCALAHAVLRGTPIPEPRLDGLRVGVLTGVPALAPDAPPSPRDERALAAAAVRLGGHVEEVALPVPEADVWPVFYAGAAESHRATFPARREEYGRTIRAKLDAAQRVDVPALAPARAALAAWRTAAQTAPAVDVVVSPTLGVDDLPPADVDELEVRVAVSAYTRPFNFLGWPAIALGELQLAARDEATLLATALAWEHAGR